jgi:SAM-dependent methyltransferase
MAHEPGPHHGPHTHGPHHGPHTHGPHHDPHTHGPHAHDCGNGNGNGNGHGHGDHGHDHGDADTLRNVLDLDAEVARPQLEALTAHVAELTASHPVNRILDVGTGTGTGTFALLNRFPEAVSTAVDTSGEMLGHLRESAARHGVADRVHPVEADLDAGWPTLGPADLIWASSSMHHMADPDRVLRDIRSTLAPGGLFVMIEMEHMPRFLPPGFADDLEDRCLAAAHEARADHLPHIGSPWSARLAEAGFTVVEERTLTVELPAPLPPNAIRYATTVLNRYRTTLAGHLTPADLTALDDLPTGSLSLRSTRDVWLAR